MRSLGSIMTRSLAALAACCLVAAVGGCGGGGGGGGDMVVQGASIKGKVINAATDGPAVGVAVSAGGKQATTAVDGTFRLTAVPINTTRVQVSDPGNRFYVFNASQTVGGATTAVDPTNIVVLLQANQEADIGVIGLYDKNGPPPPPNF
ncbi:MAG: hypothetical protein IT210_08145 [Armatimonadetes bacterium]|nr:hypothetical protein [Armatimonadota bacterium]